MAIGEIGWHGQNVLTRVMDKEEDGDIVTILYLIVVVPHVRSQRRTMKTVEVAQV